MSGTVGGRQERTLAHVDKLTLLYHHFDHRRTLGNSRAVAERVSAGGTERKARAGEIERGCARESEKHAEWQMAARVRMRVE